MGRSIAAERRACTRRVDACNGIDSYRFSYPRIFSSERNLRFKRRIEIGSTSGGGERRNKQDSPVNPAINARCAYEPSDFMAHLRS